MMNITSEWRNQFGRDAPMLHIDVHGCCDPPDSPAHLTIGLGAMSLRAHALGAHSFQAVQLFGTSLQSHLSAALESLRLPQDHGLVRIVTIEPDGDHIRFAGVILTNRERCTQ